MVGGQLLLDLDLGQIPGAVVAWFEEHDVPRR